MLHQDRMEYQEKELLEGYRKLGQESKRCIMETVMTVVMAESAVKRQYGLPLENNLLQETLLSSDRNDDSERYLYNILKKK